MVWNIVNPSTQSFFRFFLHSAAHVTPLPSAKADKARARRKNITPKRKTTNGRKKLVASGCVGHDALVRANELELC